MNSALKLLVLLFSLLCASCSKVGTAPPSRELGITTAQAVKIARKHCDGHVNLPADTAVVVSETNGCYLVTFPIPYTQHLRTGDYYAQAVINKRSGAIERFLVAP